jgi:RNA polymerase sigma-70 factor, ECF subfamily
VSTALARAYPAELVSRDAAADLAELYRRHAQEVLRWARRLGAAGVDPEEVVQDVFVVVHRKLSGFRGESTFRTWLFRITRNVVRQRRRKERIRRLFAGEGEPALEERPAGGPSALEDLEALEQRQRLHRVLGTMSEKYRTVLVLFELEEHSGEEIAELLGAKVGTVWVWLHRARAEFHKRLRALDEAEGE